MSVFRRISSPSAADCTRSWHALGSPTLKQGRPFSDPKSMRWVLQEAQGFADNTSLDKLAQEARGRLSRVVEEHAGTPWAHVAALELEAPLAWQWTER